MILTKQLQQVFKQSNSIYLYLIITFAYIVDTAKLYDKPRLPTNLIPYNYDLKILTKLEGSPELFRYHGTVSIYVHVHKSTNLVVLHARYGIINDTEIEIYDKENGEKLNILQTEYNRRRDYFIIQIHKKFRRGRSYVLSIPFGNNLRQDINSGYFVGYNRNGYKQHKSWFSLTFFQRNFIRNVLPSFDEPALRATFNVTLGHHNRFQSFSNMPLLMRFKSDLDDYVWSMHKVSPLIPTYLLAFSINNFTCMFTKTNRQEPVIFRTCSHIKNVKALSVSALVAPKVFQYFENLFRFSYPLRKIEQLAIPNLPVAAIEHWGLIIYSDTMILQKKQKNVLNLKQSQMQTVQLVAHELAHMWFGDLITASWWDSLWLNEGLAGYFEVKGVEYVNKKFGQRILFNYREGALMNEVMDTPMSITNSSEMGVNQNISIIYVYQKATSIIQMLNAIMGNELFYEGLHFYIKHYSFSHTTPDQFWDKMELACNRDNVLPVDQELNTIMDSWTTQGGYPILDVIRIPENNSILLIQNHFSFNENYSDVWWMPLTFTTQSERNFTYTRTKVWLNQKSIDLKIPLLTKEWIMFNIQGVGYYRVNYDENNWALIAADLFENYTQIHVLNRAQLVSDCLYLWQKGRIRWLTAANVLKYIIEEDEYEPLAAFIVGVTNGFWGLSPESSLIIVKWLSSAGKWYAEFINYMFDWFVVL